MALLVAFLIFLPNLLWEIRNGYPTIALLHTVIGTKYSTVSPLTYVGEQFLLVNPLAAPFWLAGLYFFLFDREGRKYAVLGYAYLIVLLEMILLHGKIYYLAPAYIMLLAVGAVWWERKIFVRFGIWLKPAVLVPIILSGIIAAPLAMRASGPVRKGLGGKELIPVLRDTGLTMLVWAVAVALALTFG